VTEHSHRSVLAGPALEALGVKRGGLYVDGTYGRGGHARAILGELSADGQLWLVDKDDEAVAHARARFGEDARCQIRHGSFRELGDMLSADGLTARVDGLLLDLGVSSPQLDAGERGFSFLRDGPLDMRMDRRAGVTAYQWLASADTREIAGVLRRLGEERFAGPIARAIVRARDAGELPRTTAGLAELISAAVPRREPGKHPATRAFQAIRIHLNRELEDLEQLLADCAGLLAPGGRLVVISFHSLEDRLVKRFMRDASRVGELPPGVAVAPPEKQPRFRLVGRAQRPDAAEIAANPRARSAIMRVAERLP
jgi:16S rRNA (cytosine1402-N4)-methyltransferase